MQPSGSRARESCVCLHVDVDAPSSARVPPRSLLFTFAAQELSLFKGGNKEPADPPARSGTSTAGSKPGGSKVRASNAAVCATLAAKHMTQPMADGV